MKQSYDRQHMCLLLILSLCIPTWSALFQKRMLKVEEGTPLHKLITDLEEFYDVQLKGKDFKKDKVEGDEPKITYTNKEKESVIEITVSGTLVNISMNNKYEGQNLSLENVDFADQKDIIQNDYVEPFLNHVVEIKGSPQEIFDDVSKALDGLSFVGSFGTGKLENMKVIGAAAPPKKKSNSKQKSKAPKKADKKKDSGPLVFNVEYRNESMKEEMDPIYGEITPGTGGYNLTLVSKFFQKTFELKVTTDNYLEGEAKNLGTQVLIHLDAMFLLNQDSETNELKKEFSPEKYIEKAAKYINDSISGVEAKVEGENIKCNLGDKLLATVTIKTESTESYLMFTVIKIKMDALGGEEIGMSFPQSSVYTLDAIANFFIGEKIRRAKKVLSGSNSEESVAVFKD